MKVDRLICLGVVALTGFRWMLADSLELTGEEAVFWEESKRLGPYFFDHGPLAPCLIRVGTWMLGDTLLGLRLWNPLLILLATWLVYLVARSVYHQVVARWSVVVFQLCPLVNLAGVFMIDVALALAFSLLGFWCLWRGLHRVHRWHGAWWIGGLALGLAITLSQALATLLMGAALSLLLISRWRDQWRRPGIWILFVVSGSVVAISYWACGHGALALREPFSVRGFYPLDFFSGLARCGFWTGPLFIVGLVWVGRRWRRMMASHGPSFLAILGVAPLLGGVVWSGLFAGWSYLWWVGMAPCLIVLVGQWMQEDLELGWKSRWRRWALLTTGGLSVLGMHTENLGTLGIPWPRAAATPRVVGGWAETAEAVGAVLLSGATREPDGLFAIAETPSMAALLDFYLARETPVSRPSASFPRVHVVESAGWESPYDLWSHYSHATPGTDGPSPFLGRTGLYVSRQPEEDLPPNLVEAFKSVEPAAVLEIKRRGRVLHRWYLYHVYEYRGLPF